jgi:putative endonuclease
VTNREVGAAGEEAVATWYLEHGYEILARNWRCRDGEIDLIVLERSVIAFCEVKTRSGDRFGHPAEAVTAKKQARIRRLAARWLSETTTRPRTIRFDVASVLAGEVEILESAF